MSATGCVVESSEECCGMKLDLAIKNCTDFTVYRLVPPPICSIGYCAGHRLPCPEGLTSADGFTPCECKLTNFDYPRRILPIFVEFHGIFVHAKI